MHAIQVLIRKQLSAAWRHRWPAVLFTWLVCALGWGMTFMIPNQYESSARLYVDADAVLTPLLRGLAVDSASATQLDTLQRTLLSRPNLEKLISKTDLELSLRGPADRELMVQGLANSIRITPQTRNLFTISYRSESPQLTFDVVRTMLTTFVESKTGTNRTDLENAGKFFQDQIGQYERQLRDAERRRAEFRTKYVELLPGDGGTSRLEQAQITVRSLQGQLIDALAKRETLSKELASTPQLVVTETEGGGVGGGSGSRLRDAERQLQELRLRYTDQHPDVITMRNLVSSIRSGGAGADEPSGAGLARAPRNRSVTNPVFEQLKLRLVEHDSFLASLQRQTNDAVKDRDRLDEVARGAPGLQAEFVNLNRDYDVLRKNYEDLLARRESMRISTAAEVDSDKVKIQVIDPPQVPQNPVAPKRTLLLSGVLLAGIAAGVGLALLLVQMDQSFHSVEELRDLGFPVMGGVSMIGSVVPFARRAFSVGAFSLAALVPAVVYSGLLMRLLRSGTQI